METKTTGTKARRQRITRPATKRYVLASKWQNSGEKILTYEPERRRR